MQESLTRAGMNARLMEVTKNNGVSLTAIAAEKNNMLCNYYVDNDIRMIQQHEATVEEVAPVIAGRLQVQAEQAPFSADGIKALLEEPDSTRIMLKVINHDQNVEMLRDVPHRDIHGDLSLISVYRVSDDATAVITNSLAAQMGYTATELLDYAIRNANHEQHVVQSMRDMLAESMGISPEEAQEMFQTDDNTMIVVTNTEKKFGAADIFVDKPMRAQIAEKIGGDYYILPSSIHEVICVSADTMSPEQAAAMVSEVNATQLDPVDVLSDHPYLVNAETLKISNPCVKQEELVADDMRHSIHM